MFWLGKGHFGQDNNSFMCLNAPKATIFLILIDAFTFVCYQMTNIKMIQLEKLTEKRPIFEWSDF